MDTFIPLSIPNFEGNEERYVVDAIASTFVSTVGGYVKIMEEKLASFLKVENVAVCQSGTSALHLSMVEAGVKPGDVVIVPPLTFIAAVNPVKYQFATPVFIDCDDSFCMDAEKLRSFCEEECEWNGKELTHNDASVKALVVVHVFGNIADMESIMDIAGKYNIMVIEDATEALGTRYTKGRYKDKYAGTIGHFGCYSFNGNKIITTGGGGAVTASEPQIVDHIRFLSTQAKTDPHYYIHNEVGYNYRMTNLQAALGVAQIEKLSEFIIRKKKNYDLYKELFDGFEYGKVMPFRDGTDPNYWFYSLCIDRNHIATSMREIIVACHDKGFETRAIWGLINEQKPYEGEETYKLEQAPYYANRILNIPSSTQIREEEIKYVADELKRLLRSLANG